MSERAQPFNADAERSVLGSVLIKAEVFRTELAAALVGDDFYVPGHREIFDSMVAIDGRGQAIDHVTLAEELGRRGALKRLDGGEAYLVALAATVPSVENVEYYIEIVRAKSALRRLIAACALATSRAFGDVEDAWALVGDHAAEIAKVATGRRAKLRTLAELGPTVIDNLEKRAIAASKNEKVQGVRFGVEPLDELLCGILPTEQCILAADVGGGKTALALQASITHALLDGGVVLDFSMEMTDVQLAERAFVHLSQIDSYRTRRGFLNVGHFRKLYEVQKRISEAKLYMDGASQSLRDIQAQVRYWRAMHRKEPGLVVVDFLQLIRFEMKRGASRAEAVGSTAYALKNLYKETYVAGITLSQLNREGNKEKTDREGVVIRKPPSKHDLKESGDIEAAADQIVMLYNPEHVEDGEMQAHVVKARSGMCRMVKLHWVGRHFLFKTPESWAPASREHWSDKDAA